MSKTVCFTLMVDPFFLGSSSASFDDTLGEYICGENIKNCV